MAVSNFPLIVLRGCVFCVYFSISPFKKVFFFKLQHKIIPRKLCAFCKLCVL
jgi:hypothetical protein